MAAKKEANKVKVMALRNFTYKRKQYKWLAWYDVSDEDAMKLLEDGLVRMQKKQR
jgi:hypothetical protein